MLETTASETDVRLDRELQVIGWRQEQLLRAGYELVDAGALAVDTAVDLHAAVALRRSGCPSATAVRILL